jgi:GNAT superfamily N-acetyltransferase
MRDAAINLRALTEQRDLIDHAAQVLGYYALAAGAVSHQMAASKVRRHLPVPVPVMVLARLAVDRRAQGVHVGAALLCDAVNRVVTAPQHTGVGALLVQALHSQAAQFYQHYGFAASPPHPSTLMLALPRPGLSA